MAEFIFVYRSPAGSAPASSATANAWRTWFAGLGSALHDMGRPVFSRATIGTASAESTQLGGYSVVTAQNLDEALALAKGCPAVAAGGGVDVGELADIPAEVLAGQNAS
jgi:hypothetical protein